MCTVTYIPRENNQFILTSNRDEQPNRSPQSISRTQSEDLELIFPRDKTAGGTWIAVSNQNRVVCLLNGAYNKHHYEPPYRKSRGIMVLEYFDFESIETFRHHYDFDGMEPFTMIVIEQNQLFELRWDEKRTHFKKLQPHRSYIWSSATLYTSEMMEKREIWFEEWKENRIDFSQKAILDLHLNGGEGNPDYDFVMNRKDIVKTVSITSIVKNCETIEMHYRDLIKETINQAEIKISSEILKPY